MAHVGTAAGSSVYTYGDCLPPELWTMIFAILSAGDRIRVRRVCSAWKDLIINTPSVWQNLHVTASKMRGKVYAGLLLLSKDIPLSLSLHLDGRERSIDIVVKTIQHMNHVQHLEVHSSNGTDIMSLLQNAAPMLVSLSLGPSASPLLLRTLPNDLFAGDSPKLTHLDVGSIALPMHCGALRLVTHLRARPGSHSQLAHIFQVLPRLTHLRLSTSYHGTVLPPHPEGHHLAYVRLAGDCAGNSITSLRVSQVGLLVMHWQPYPSLQAEPLITSAQVLCPDSEPIVSPQISWTLTWVDGRQWRFPCTEADHYYQPIWKPFVNLHLKNLHFLECSESILLACAGAEWVLPELRQLCIVVDRKYSFFVLPKTIIRDLGSNQTVEIDESVSLEQMTDSLSFLRTTPAPRWITPLLDAVCISRRYDAREREISAQSVVRLLKWALPTATLSQSTLTLSGLDSSWDIMGEDLNGVERLMCMCRSLIFR